MAKLISLVIPVLNESENIDPLYNSITKEIKKFSKKYDFEFIFNDNKSSDDTLKKLCKLKYKDKRIRINVFSRNVGYQNSIFYGYQTAKGDAVIQIDADLQDPPSLISKFIDKWEQNYKVVYGVRKTTKDSLIMKLSRKFFYRLINFISSDYLPLDAGDFRLVDREVVDLVSQINDSHIYIRGYIASFGFNQIGIPYDRKERKKGVSKFKFKDLLKLAIDGLLNHTVIPLRFASIFGIFVSLATILLIFGFILAKLLFGIHWPNGFTTTIVLILFSISLNALFLGIIGEYIGRIFFQTKEYPKIIVEKKI